MCGACLSRALHGHTVQHQPAATMKPALAVFAFSFPSPELRVAKYLSMLLNKTCLPASLFSQLLSLERKTQKKKKSCLLGTSPSPGRELRGSSPAGFPRFFPRLPAASRKGWMLPVDEEGAGRAPEGRGGGGGKKGLLSCSRLCRAPRPVLGGSGQRVPSRGVGRAPPLSAAPPPSLPPLRPLSATLTAPGGR